MATRRRIVFTLCFMGLTAVALALPASAPGLSRGEERAREQQIKDLEKQLLDLNGKLNELKKETPKAVPALPPEPQTKVAVMNLSYVIKNYKKWETFQNDYKTKLEAFDKKLKPLTRIIHALARAAFPRGEFRGDTGRDSEARVGVRTAPLPPEAIRIAQGLAGRGKWVGIERLKAPADALEMLEVRPMGRQAYDNPACADEHFRRHLDEQAPPCARLPLDQVVAAAALLQVAAAGGAGQSFGHGLRPNGQQGWRLGWYRFGRCAEHG